MTSRLNMTKKTDVVFGINEETECGWNDRKIANFEET